MTRESITLSERGAQRLRNLVRKSEAAVPVRAVAGQPRGTQPVLAKAIDAVAALGSGSFRVQAATPGALVDSGIIRTAYALVDIAANDLVSLVWHASPQSGGFYAALAPASSAVSPSVCDVCGLVELVEELHTLTTEQQAKADAIKATCGCQSTTPCSMCAGGEAAELYQIEITGLSIGNPYPTVMTNTQWLTLRDWVQQPRTAEPGEDGPFCVADFDFGQISIGGDTYTLGNDITSSVYRIYLAPLFPTGPAVPSPIVYRNGSNFGFVIGNYGYTENANCLDSRSFVATTPNEPFQLPTQLPITIVVEPTA